MQQVCARAAVSLLSFWVHCLVGAWVAQAVGGHRTGLQLSATDCWGSYWSGWDLHPSLVSGNKRANGCFRRGASKWGWKGEIVRVRQGKKKREKPLEHEVGRREKEDSEERGQQKYGKQWAGVLASLAALTLLTQLSWSIHFTSHWTELNCPRAQCPAVPCSTAEPDPHLPCRGQGLQEWGQQPSRSASPTAFWRDWSFTASVPSVSYSGLLRKTKSHLLQRKFRVVSLLFPSVISSSWADTVQAEGGEGRHPC